jgi:hypothetical protein
MLSCASVACTPSSSRPAPTPAPEAPLTSASFAAPAPAPTPVPAALPFIEDDYDRALAEARAANKPLFVDAWAPWCHSCLSMRAYTFRDAAVRAHAGEFVWASIDTENAKNAAWVEAHPTHAMPTLFVVDPKTGGDVLAWPSSATPDELVKLLGDARVAMTKGRMPLPDAGAATALEAKLDGLNQKKEYVACAEAGDRELPALKKGAGRAISLALVCIDRMPAGEAKKGLLERALTRAQAIAADTTDPMLPDDRSGLYEEIVDALDTDGRQADAKAVARTWAAFLEGEAKHAPDATAREVFDAHRLEAYEALGEPERAVPMLEATAKDFPKDYNPPARLARAYLAMKRYDDATTSVDRALALVYGPRTLRILALKSEIQAARGDRTAAIATLKDALARAAAMKLTARYVAVRTELERRLAALDGGGSAR